MRAAIYARISKARRDEDGPETLGVDRQVENCKKLAARLEATVEHIYIDNDKSGKAGVLRPEYEELLKAIAENKLDVVLCYKTDRLSRDRIALQFFYELLKEHKVGLHTDTEGLVELETADGALMAGIRAELAQYERAVTAMRVSRQKEQAAQSGRVLGGRFRMFGYTDKTRTTVNEVEAEAIREIADAFLRGNSMHSLAVLLNDKGITGVSGSPFRARDIRRILTNRAYIGERVFNGEVVATGDWPTILDRDVFERMQPRLSTQQKWAPTEYPRKYLLTGVLYCTRCQHKVTGGRRGDGIAIYRCLRSDGGCGKVSRVAEPIEKAVLKATAQLVRVLPVMTDTVDTSALDRIEADLDLLQQARSNGDIDMQTFLATNKQLQVQRKEQLALVHVTSDMRNMSGKAHQFLKSSTDEQRETIRKFFGEIGLVPVGRGKRAAQFDIGAELKFNHPLEDYFAAAERGTFLV